MVMSAETGQFQPAGDTYTLTLDGVDEEMLAFTDRPEREAQTWDTSAFLDYWANEFGDDPPNAVVSADGVRVAVTLSDPRVGMSARDDGAVTPSAGAVTFTATPLPGQEPPISVITQPTLFIDDVDVPPSRLHGPGACDECGDRLVLLSSFSLLIPPHSHPWGFFEQRVRGSGGTESKNLCPHFVPTT